MIKTDLGIENGRHYVLFVCSTCGVEAKRRLDQVVHDNCKTCRTKMRSEELRATFIQQETKVCSMCKLEKPKEAFGSKSATLSKLRSACKLCRSKAEQATNANYRKTAKGKAVSANCQGRRRADKLSSCDGSVTSDALNLLKEQQQHKCYHCGNALQYDIPKQVHLDHLVPLSRGGTHTLSNVAWSCASCNLAKNNSI